jgi:hypothetical protein
MAAISPELLVTRGLFPENLPPIYTAKDIWAALSPQVTTYSVTHKASGDLSFYNASKRGGQRRLFGVPHPVFIKDQGLFFEKHWDELQSLLGAAPGSVSRPILDSAGPRHVRITPHQELPKLRLKRLSRFKYCLITDVSRFFPSVYTHSFAWAFNGKAPAKADTKSNSGTVYGNRLDFITRQAQSRQTIGIPIGPDTSKIAAELLMSAVDRRFIEISGKIIPTYIRHVDDYWIGGHTYDACEKHLKNLRLALKEYQLDINETKTRIISTKFVFGETWPSEFEREIRDSLGMAAKFVGLDPISTFGKVVDRATRENDDGVIKRVIRIIDESRLWESNWDILEHFLAQCAVQFPHSFDYVARVIAWRVRTTKPIDRALWIEIAERTAFQDGKLGRDSEVVWALWLLKELKQRLSKALSDTILGNSGSLVLSFLAHFPKHRLASDRKLWLGLRDIVDGDPFAGTFWPLTLELAHLGEGDPKWTGHSTIEVLRTLHSAKISIIDWAAPPKVFLHAPENGDDDHGGPDFAIEDYGSDYGEIGGEEDGEEDGEGEEVPIFPAIDLNELPI